MNFLWNKITEWIKGLLISGIMSNLNGLFDSLNGQVAEIAGTVGATPQGWNGSVFNMIKSLSDNVIVPIAGAILTFVMCYELIQMVIDKNSFHDFETFVFMKWTIKTAIGVLLLSHAWDIVMGIFAVAQNVVNAAAGTIITNTDMNIASVIADLETGLQSMEIGPLFGLWFQSMLVGIISWAMTICIFVVVYGRIMEIYLVASVAPIPFAALGNREWGQIGQNYIRSLIALGLQALLIIICVAIYAVLVHSIAVDTDVIKALWTCIGYTVLLCFTLFKTSSLSKTILNAH